MSGRAGRRGKDTSGTCIMFLDDKMTAENCSEMIAMGAPPLNSSFRLTYNMLLNLKRVDLSGVTNVKNFVFLSILLYVFVCGDIKFSIVQRKIESQIFNFKKDDSKFGQLGTFLQSKII